MEELKDLLALLEAESDSQDSSYMQRIIADHPLPEGANASMLYLTVHWGTGEDIHELPPTPLANISEYVNMLNRVITGGIANNLRTIIGNMEEQGNE